MKRVILVDKFSLNMVKPELLSRVRLASAVYLGDGKFQVGDVVHTLTQRAVTHKETAAKLSDLMGTTVGRTRTFITMSEDDVLIVAQYNAKQSDTIELVAVYIEPLYVVYTVGNTRKDVESSRQVSYRLCD